jgi:hypothetical protein
MFFMTRENLVALNDPLYTPGTNILPRLSTGISGTNTSITDTLNFDHLHIMDMIITSLHLREPLNLPDYVNYVGRLVNWLEATTPYKTIANEDRTAKDFMVEVQDMPGWTNDPDASVSLCDAHVFTATSDIGFLECVVSLFCHPWFPPHSARSH